MTFFTGLSMGSNLGEAAGEEGTYLGIASKKLKEKKRNVVIQLLGPGYDTQRPKLDGRNTLDNKSIFRFIAQENLECAFNCDPLTGVEMVTTLSQIIIGSLPEGKYIHISTHPNYLKARNEEKKPYEHLLAYFEVNIQDIRQDTSEAGTQLEDFRKIYKLAISGSGNQ